MLRTFFDGSDVTSVERTLTNLIGSRQSCIGSCTLCIAQLVAVCAQTLRDGGADSLEQREFRELFVADESMAIETLDKRLLEGMSKVGDNVAFGDNARSPSEQAS